MRRFKTRARTTKAFVVLSAVLILGSLGVGVFALAAPSVPAPTISSKPANPTNATSASFTYTDSSSITRFECSLDVPGFTACGTSRPSSKTFAGPLSQGPHTFQVRAVSGSNISAATSYTWTIDTTPPHVLSINRAGPNPTNSSSVSWTVTFSESVTGVDSSDFQLVNSGLVLPFITGVSGSGSVYTVTASTGLAGSGTLGLKLVDNDSIRDAAGNSLGGAGAGNGNFTGQVYTIDKTPPPTPVLTQHPSDPSPTAVSTFAWTGSEAGVTFKCALENGSFNPCTSPYTFTVNTTNNGVHQFEVEAIDAAGNVSDDVDFSWNVSPSGFTISGNSPTLYPGLWRYIPVAITNPNNYALILQGLTVSVSSSPPGCPASSNIAFIQSSLSTSNTYTVAAHSTVVLPQAYQPQIQLKNLPVNQDICKNGTFQLQYGGTATK